MGTRRGEQVNGILLLDKPAGITSTHALNRAKRALNARRAGHTGSLDPLASGMLPLTFGEATKLSAFLLNAEKRYRVEVRLGIATETGDADGAIRDARAVGKLNDADIEAALERFRGEIKQIPPMYSALKHHGERLYTLARKGVTVEREPRAITIYELRLVGREAERLHLEVRCSKGTYVRTLAEDIGMALGTLAHVSALRRTGVAGYEEGDGLVPLATLEADSVPAHFLLPADSALRDWPAVTLSRDLAYFLRHGQPVMIPRAPMTGWLRLYDEGEQFIGVGEMLEDGRVAPRRLVNTVAA
ncbi:MAG: tRNA pseudouridine(55) synthase TruB [Gammaproteobacteria bacterium]